MFSKINKMRTTLLSLFAILFSVSLHAQMINGTDTLYGNEWIDYDKTYYEIKLAEDGVYKITFDELESMGFPVNQTTGANIQMFYMGEQYPLHLTTNGNLGSNDYIEFLGRKNRGELDHHLYIDGRNDQLNPEYSLFTDTATYFITFDNSVQGLRYEEYDQGGNLTPEAHYMHEELYTFNNFHFKPNYRGNDHVRYSYFDIGEGYGTTTSDDISINLQAEDILNNATEKSKFHVRFGSNPNHHSLEVKFNNTLIAQEDYLGVGIKDYEIEIENADLNANNSLEITGSHDDPLIDGYSLAFAKLHYPRPTVINGNAFQMQMNASSSDKYYEFEVDNTSDEYVIYDLINGHRLQTSASGNILRFKIASSTEDRKILVYNTTEEKTISSAESRSFIDYTTVDPDFLFLTSKRLFESPNGVVQSYADYRLSPAGGSYNPYIVLMEDLIDQFAYGIDRHNIANRNFAHFVEKNWSGLEYWYNVGRGLEYNLTRTAEDLTAFYSDNHVQTFGAPGSDMVMISSSSQRVPKFKLGRIAVTNEEELEVYYNKILLQNDFSNLGSTFEERAWTKEMIHLSGGDPFIQDFIFNNLESMRVIIENNMFGANVNTFRKTTTNPIQPADIAEILSLIDNGLSIITFFGHSGVGTFDFSIESPSGWENQGKFPLVMSLGCLSGNVFTKSKGLSEEFVLEPERGAIAFLASAGTAYIGSQSSIGASFYDYLGGEMYGSTLGEVIEQVYIDNQSFNSLAFVTLMQQLTLHGDPAIRLNPHPGTDYTFDFSSIKTDPRIVDTNLDSFEVSFDLTNIGAFKGDSMNVRVEHELRDGTTSFSSEVRVEAFPYRKNIKVKIPIVGLNITGKNSIKAFIDTDDEVEELPNPGAELNNEIKSQNGEDAFCFFATNNSLNPVCPQDYGIVNTEEVILYAATLNAFETTENKYLFEIDTTQSFDSPSLTRYEETSKGGMLRWTPEINFTPGETYYWRTTPDSTSALVGYQWKDHSFVYLPDADYGWNHNHIDQYVDNDLDGFDFNLEQEMIFDTSARSIEIINGLWNPLTRGIKVENGDFSATARPWQALSTGIAISVIDPLTGVFWVNGTGGPWGGDFGSVTGNQGVRRSYAFPTNTTEDRAKVINFLSNDIPDGHYVVFWTLISDPGDDFLPEEWAQDSISLGTNLFQVLEAQGATRPRDMMTLGSVPYNFTFQQNTSPLNEDIAEVQEGEISSLFFIPRPGIEGAMTTVAIGPAKEWDRVEWRSNQVEINDASNFYVEAYNPQNELDSTYSYLNTTDGVIDLSFLDADLFPVIKLKYESNDATDRTTPQVEYLRVFYEGYPDIALDPLSNLVFRNDTLQQGEDLFIRYDITNVSSFDLEDSIFIEYIITDSQNQNLVFNDNYEPLAAGASQEVRFRYGTEEMVGDYTITINVNLPDGATEKINFNNFGIRSFTVVTDNQNPLLDVTFDGYHILDGDIVAAEPLISIVLEDDNPFLLLTEEGTIQLILTHPNGDIEFFEEDDPRLQFYPAENSEDNKARLEFSPFFQNDGEYKLQVQGWDASGNISGSNEYVRNFQVINKEAVSNVLNYPNPFSTSTQFIFTLTGNIPDFMNIEIRTMSGKVVKEIQKEELGILRIGINKTDYKWNGTDEFGQKLANGVYLYRVVTKNAAGESYEAYDNGTDTFFTKGYGKMVIMR